MKFGKVILDVADVEASLAFYEKAFGLKTRFIREAGYGEVQVDGTTISLATFETGRRRLPEGFTRRRRRRRRSAWRSPWSATRSTPTSHGPSAPVPGRCRHPS